MRALIPILTFMIAMAAAPTLAAEPSPISEAETVLFMTDHLQGVQAPATLRYTIRHGGSMEQGFDDTAEVKVSRGKDKNAKSVSARFLSGERTLELPAVESAGGENPVLIYFLERDIREMKRLTGAKNQIYFQKRIRLALAENARVRPVTVTLDGREISATEIRISPYVDDPNKDKFEKYTGKYYVFTLSDAVPGHIYRAHSVIPDKEGAPPLVEDVLTYAGKSAAGAKKN
ncbi:MAG TPA: hypothetical protein VLC55_00515 [Burkholderiales bacterium]|nr:hypothetical protein [Burkholderiales bacterium]